MINLDLFLNPSALPFTVAIVVALCLGVLELINLLIGGITDWFDTLIPEKDFSIEPGTVSITDFLCIGRIPFLMWLVTFLLTFGLIGVISQSIIQLTFWISIPVVLIISTIPVRYISLFLSKVLPKDETTALYSESFIGLVAVIVLGEARTNYPAQAKFKDMHNQVHYVMVEPEYETDVFKHNDEIILTSFNNSSFKAIKNSI